MLIPENTTRKIDSLGRITLPKGLRDRMFLSENAELELFTANIDGRQCICLASPVNEEAEIQNAIDFLVEKGYSIEKEG
nr:MAG TPA: AbrB family transcriptional regulator-like protein [Caudoviricetes sp.]